MFCGAHSSFYCLPLTLILILLSFPFVFCLLFCKMFYIKINFMLELLNIYVPCPAAFSACLSVPQLVNLSVFLSVSFSVCLTVILLLFSPDNAPRLIPSNGHSSISTVSSLSLSIFFPAARLP